jgi:hypothetical protein
MRLAAFAGAACARFALAGRRRSPNRPVQPHGAGRSRLRPRNSIKWRRNGGREAADAPAPAVQRIAQGVPSLTRCPSGGPTVPLVRPPWARARRCGSRTILPNSRSAGRARPAAGRGLRRHPEGTRAWRAEASLRRTGCWGRTARSPGATCCTARACSPPRGRSAGPLRRRRRAPAAAPGAARQPPRLLRGGARPARRRRPGAAGRGRRGRPPPLVVVGAGISGLAAAHFFRDARPGARS